MFLSGANLFFNTRGHHWLISCSFSPEKHLPAQYRIGNLPRFPSPSLVLGCNRVGKILKESGACIGSRCHLHPCCTPPTYRSGSEYTGSCFDFPPCWYSPDFFKDHIQWCAGKHNNQFSSNGGGVLICSLCQVPCCKHSTTANFKKSTWIRRDAL